MNDNLTFLEWEITQENLTKGGHSRRVTKIDAGELIHCNMHGKNIY